MKNFTFCAVTETFCFNPRHLFVRHFVHVVKHCAKKTLTVFVAMETLHESLVSKRLN